MFVIVYNNSVILGPMRWNRFRFENTIEEDCEFSVRLPDRNDSLDPVIVSDNIKILPVQGTQNPEFNPTTEMLHGPFWEFTDSAAIASYVAQPLPIDAVKNMLKARVSAERYRKEIIGTTTAIQDVQVTVDTSRDGRNIFVQKYILMNDADTVQWKFPETWLTLSKTELGQVVNAGVTYIQQQFDWESAKISEIDSCETMEQLAVIEIEPVQSIIG